MVPVGRGLLLEMRIGRSKLDRGGTQGGGAVIPYEGQPGTYRLNCQWERCGDIGNR